jgi:hypothetical protein
VEVVEHQPGGWFLLTDGDHHYLDVNCSLPLVDTTILLRLDEDEDAELRALGRPFVESFAAKVNHWSGRYRERHVGGDTGERAADALTRYLRAERPG